MITGDREPIHAAGGVELREAIEALCRNIESRLEEPQCVLLQRGAEPSWKALALAALAHAAVLLRRLEHESAVGNELVARLIARAHVETVIVGLYTTYEQESAVKTLLGAWRKNLLVLHNKAVEANADFEVLTEEPFLDAGVTLDSIEGTDRPDAAAILEEVFGEGLPETKVAYEQLADLVDRAASEAGDLARMEAKLLYAASYRGLSTLGAHVNYWLLEQYIDRSGILTHVRPESKSPPLARGATRSAYVFTALLATIIFSRLDVDVDPFSVVLRDELKAMC